MKPDKKTMTFRLSTRLMLKLWALGKHLGVGKGDMVSLSVALALVRLTPLIETPRKREIFLKEVEKDFQNLLDDVREKAL